MRIIVTVSDEMQPRKLSFNLSCNKVLALKFTIYYLLKSVNISTHHLTDEVNNCKT